MAEEPSRSGALSSKVTVVVGGASGIGRAAANALARQGSRVVIADFDAQRLERTVEEILLLGIADAMSLQTDVRNEASVRAMAGDSIKAMGQVDILINMAGVFLRGPIERLRTSDWKWVFDTNLMGTVRTTMAFAPHMVERGTGHIINTVSAGGTSPLTIPYDSCCAAVSAFTEALAGEMKPKGVNVSLFSIGAGGPRIGQNTRSRGMGRLLHPGRDLEEPSQPDGQLIDQLVEMVNP